MLYVDSNIFPDVDKENNDPSTSLALETIGEMRHHREQAMLTLLRNRLENKRRELTTSAIETSSQVENDKLQIQAVFDSFSYEINQMPEERHKQPLDRTLEEIVKQSNVCMIPAAALDLEKQRAQNLSSLSSERFDEENRGNHMLFLSLLYLTLFFNRESN